MTPARFVARCSLLVALSAAGCVSGGGADPAYAKEMRERGDEAYEQGDFEGAIAYYTTAIEHNPQYAEAFHGRGNAYTALPERPDSKAGTREALLKAIDDFSATLARNPAHYNAYWNRAVLAAFFRQYQAAAKDFLQCTLLRPSEPEAHLRLGELYETKLENMLVRAMEHYEKYVRLGGTNDEILAKVRAWQELKTQTPAPPPKGPTPDEEEKAKELHHRLTALVGQGKNEEAFQAVDDLVTKFVHTKYVRDRLAAFTAMHRALKPEKK